MATIYGTNTTDSLIGANEDDQIFGWDMSNPGGDEGPDTDADLLSAGAGNDVVNGGGGDDELNGDAGNDQLFGGAGRDTLDGGVGNDQVLGGEGDDVLRLGLNGGRDTLDGGVGVDSIIVDLSSATLNLRFSFVSGASGLALPGGSVLSAVEQIVVFGGQGNDRFAGGRMADTLLGSGGADSLLGGAGDDSLGGGGGRDNLEGGSGNDTLTGGVGRDKLFGGLGNDDIYVGLTDGADTVVGGSGSADFLHLTRLNATKGLSLNVMQPNRAQNIGDGTIVSGIERLAFYGGSGADHITGGRLNDRLEGNGGSDTLQGGTGRLSHDGLYGGDGRDRLIAADGDDDLEGGRGNDVLFGGSGADKFIFTHAPVKANVDRIEDFNFRADLIVLARDIFTTLTNDTLDEAAFVVARRAQDADDRIVYHRAKGLLYYDADGAGGAAAHLIAKLDPGARLGFDDFLIVPT